MNNFIKNLISIGIVCFLFLGSQSLCHAIQLQTEEQSTIDVFEKISPSVVFIKNASIQLDLFSMDVYEIPQGAGSGFVWDTDGHIVTNFHVVYQADKIEVILSDQEPYLAKIIGISPDYDLAVLKINASPEMLKSIPVGSSNGLKVGQKAFPLVILLAWTIL